MIRTRRRRRSREAETRQGCQRLGLHRRRGSKTPTPVRSPPGGQRGARVARRPAEAVVGCREAPPPPVVSHGSQNPRGLPSAQALERAGNARGTGTRSFVRVASVGRMHLAPVRAGGRKAPRADRALAGRKRAAPLTRGACGEKAKRCTLLTNFDQDLRRGGPWVSARGFAARQKALSVSHRSTLTGRADPRRPTARR